MSKEVNWIGGSPIGRVEEFERSVYVRAYSMRLRLTAH